MESSYQSTNKDMGANHVVAHKNQHKYLQKDEPLIETLSSNDEQEKTTDIALKFAQNNLGLLTPEKWFIHNKKLRKSRQKKSYLEYILSVTGNFRKAKQRRLDNPKTAKKTREKIAREMRAIIDNYGVPIDGSLFYLSNTEKYDELTADELKKYRKFEAKTFKRFYKSDVFSALNPENLRAEIHYDENGAMHLQTQDVWFYRDGRNRLTYAKRAMLKKELSNWYGGEKALQDRLDVLCEFEDIASKKGKNVGEKRADSMYFDYVQRFPLGQVSNKEKINKDGSVRKFKYSKAERNTRLEELWRIEQIYELRRIAEQTAKEMGLEYHFSDTYQTDGIHRDGASYINHKKARQKASKKIKQAKQINDDVIDSLKNSYKELTGKEAKTNSPLELTKKLKRAVQTTEKIVATNQSTIKTQQTTISKQDEYLQTQQRQLQAVQHQHQQEQEEIMKLKKQKKDLQTEIKQLQQQVKSAGLIVSRWIRLNWQRLETHFRDYAQNMATARNERLYGGANGTGDPYNANLYEQRAKKGLLASFEHIETEEVEQSGLGNAIRKSINNQSKNSNDLDR